eukprot:610239-Amphidinium_carterae.2
MGKTTKTFCVDIACHIDGSDYWSALMDAYIQDLPLQQEAEHHFQEGINNMTENECLNPTWCSSLRSLLEHLPNWRQTLRKPSLKAIEEQLLSKLSVAVQSIESEQKGADDLENLQKLMADAAVAFPMQKSVEEMQTLVAGLLSSQHGRRIMAGLVKEVDKVLGQSSLLDAVESIQAVARMAVELPSQWQDEANGVAQNCVQKVVTMVE